MIDKYKDYPNGISRIDIDSADSIQLARIIEIYTFEFNDVINEVVVFTDDLKTKLYKYNTYSSIVSKQLRDFNDENAIQVALLLGSLLEGTLQFFLYAFEQDYINARWKQWDVTEDQFSEIAQLIKEHFDHMLAEGKITKEQRDSLIKLVKCELNIRENGKNIDKIMLDELIGLCSNQKIFDPKTKEGKSTIEAMNRIRDARNNIHVFSSYSIPTMEDVLEEVKQFCLIMKDLFFRISCINEDRRREAFKEILLDIPSAIILDVNDNYEVLDVHGRDKKLIDKLMNNGEGKNK